MTDDQPNPAPGNADDDASLGGVSEAELDDMLAQAGELVDELSTQLGEPEPLPLTEAPSPEAAASLPEPPSGGSSLEDELTQLEALTEVASTEVIGGTNEPSAPAQPPETNPAAEATPASAQPRPLPEPPPPPPQYDPETQSEYEEMFPGGFPPPVPPEVVEQAIAGPTPVAQAPTDPVAAQWPIEEKTLDTAEDADDGSTEDTALEEPEEPKARPVEESDTIPDFMKEFMDPEPEEAPPPETPEVPEQPELVTQATTVPVQTKPGVVGTGTLHQVVKPGQSEDDPVSAAAPEPSVPKSANLLVQKLRGLAIALLLRLKSIGPVTPLLTRAGYWLCDKSVFVLEKADKPINGIGDRIRKLVGWLAVATVGTSLIVYVISFF